MLRPELAEAEAAVGWSERRAGSLRWWETARSDSGEQRAVVLWIRGLGKVAWWIAVDGVTLGLGYVGSLAEPSMAVIEQAMRAAEERWAEL